MSIVPRLPKYQFNEKDGLVKEYPVLVKIVENSRGRFARYFIENIANCNTTDLCDLMDQAFNHVCVKTRKSKGIFDTFDGKLARVMAISNLNVSESKAPNERTDCIKPT
ncbi:hypothetical protein THRCLA_22958 [Thraustotheca clavata]|uniref:Uncharacterized protein n=1 Tax=Thraustotheca clavata TaxID=74557 RepID=A0A1V9YLG6_9STRA|nr:hypothetical protein THRCLA_22958 [Thraustotheca clavata]